MTSNLEQLKKKIQEANPEIMEVKFGCEIRTPFTTYVIGKHTPDKENVIEILGRPIRLADVLLALENEYQAQDKSYAVDGEGTFIFVNKDVEMTWVNGSWNLKSDSLDKQSPETINFLMELLCK